MKLGYICHLQHGSHLFHLTHTFYEVSIPIMIYYNEEAGNHICKSLNFSIYSAKTVILPFFLFEFLVQQCHFHQIYSQHIQKGN